MTFRFTMLISRTKKGPYQQPIFKKLSISLSTAIFFKISSG
jgi:hypothetical protein